MSAQNLRICAEEEGRLLNCFWLTQLPPLNARGEFYDPKLVEEVKPLGQRFQTDLSLGTADAERIQSYQKFPVLGLEWVRV